MVYVTRPLPYSKLVYTYVVTAIVPYPRNDNFVGRRAILERLQQQALRSASQVRASLFGLGGIG
jgi:hypothetical protein